MRWDMTEAQARDAGFRAAYEDLAPRLIERGISAGDWRMVRLARGASEHPMQRDGQQSPGWRLSPGLVWMQQLADGEQPERTVALLRLMASGAATPDWQARYDALVERYERRLTPAQAARAKGWAEQTFHASFGGRRDLQHDAKAEPTCG
jgi:hypothetical protein